VHTAVDTCGLPHEVWVTAANVSDRDGAVEMVRKSAPNLAKVVKTLCDRGYSGEKFANAERVLIKGVALLGLIPRPLGRFALGVRGICSPVYAKISRRNLRYRRACPAVLHVRPAWGVTWR
jgi:hypothetical protein